MKIYDSQFKAFQYVLRQVPRGYIYWNSGTVSEEKLHGLADKFEEMYGTLLTPSTKHYRQKNGLANACAVAYPLSSGGYRWLLLATEGIGPIKDEEKLLDAHHQRIKLGDYVLKLGVRPREHGGGKHWSWYIDDKILGENESYSTHIIKTEPYQIKEYWATQIKRPMFSGVRSSLTRMLKSNIKLWNARGLGEWPGPVPPLPIVAGF